MEWGDLFTYTLVLLGVATIGAATDKKKVTAPIAL